MITARVDDDDSWFMIFRNGGITADWRLVTKSFGFVYMSSIQAFGY